MQEPAYKTFSLQSIDCLSLGMWEKTVGEVEVSRVEAALDCLQQALIGCLGGGREEEGQ